MAIKSNSTGFNAVMCVTTIEERLCVYYLYFKENNSALQCLLFASIVAHALVFPHRIHTPYSTFLIVIFFLSVVVFVFLIMTTWLSSYF